MEIGSVADILLQLEKVEPDRIPDEGLRGQLRMESFVTGVLYVAFDLYPDNPAQFVQPRGSRYQEIPTVPTELEEVQEQVRDVFTKLAKVDFNAVALAMTHAFEGIDQLSKSPALKASLRSLKQTMPKVDEAVVNIRRLAATLDKNANDLSSDLQQTSAVARQTMVESH